MALRYNLVTPSPATIQSLTGALVGLGGIQLGFDATNNFAVAAPSGLAICRGDGTCVAIDADADALIDVTPMVIPGVSPCVVRLPVQLESVRRGDLLVTSDSPFSALFVLKAPEGASRIRCLDPFSDEIVTYAPPRSGVLPMTWVVIAISPFSSLLCGERRHRETGSDRKRGEHDQGLRQLALAALLSQPSVNASATPPAGGGATIGTGPAGLSGLSGAWLLPLLLEGDFLGSRHDGGGGSRGLLFAVLISSLLSQSTSTPASGSTAPASALGQLAPLLMLSMLGRGRRDGDKEAGAAEEPEHRERGEGSLGTFGLLLASMFMQGQGSVPAAGAVNPPPVTAGVTGGLSANPGALLLAALAGFTGFSPRSRHDRDTDTTRQNDEEDDDDLDHDGDAEPPPA
ncbi:MAG TPA: hypothetical protein VIC29_15230 [Steroidobacteraceae bacterium]|jgi:hypothetical protein